MLKVVSASRRVDLAGAYPERFIELLREQAPPEGVHSLVIWTKNPWNLLHMPELGAEVRKYRNLFLHLTVTGMGGTVFEPGVPDTEDTIGMLKEICGLAGGPDHVRLRFDPIVHVRLADGSAYTNLDAFEGIAVVCSDAGVRNITTSWMQSYRKVVRHLNARSMAPITVSRAQMDEELESLKRVSSNAGITLHGCCVPIMPISKCIDGPLLESLHPDRLPCSHARAKGQRERCGCTMSYDIGWYEPCLHGCIYCYANPKVE